MAGNEKTGRGSGKRVKKASKKTPPVKNMRHNPSDGSTFSWRIPPRLGFVILAVLCFAVYANSLGGRMVNWDDVIVTSAWEKDLSVSRLAKEFFPIKGSYQPVRNISHIVDHALFGKNLWPYHLHSVVLYAGNVLILYGVLIFLLRRYRLLSCVNSSETEKEKASPSIISAESVAFFITALFAVHPVHAESVAWLSARKEVLFGLFYCTSFFLYIKRDEFKGSTAHWYYAGSLAFYVLSLLSKPAAASLPLVILAYDLLLFRPKAQEWKTRFLRHVPFWLPLAAAIYYFSGQAGTTETAWASLNYWERFLTSQKALLHYAEILFYPARLSARYFIDPGRSLLDAGVMGGGIISFGLLVLLIFTIRKRPLISFAVVWFYVNWLPTAGFIPISTKVADRYIYLAMLGFCILLVVLLVSAACIVSGKTDIRRRITAYVVVPLLVAVLAGYGCSTVLRNGVWKDEPSLWEDMARKSPTDLSMNHMAKYHLDRKEWNEAEQYYKQSLEIDPTQRKIWNNLGNVLMIQEKVAEAEKAFVMALSIKPKPMEEDLVEVREGAALNLSLTLARQKKYAPAEKTLKKLIEQNTSMYRAWEMLAEVLMAQGKVQPGN